MSEGEREHTDAPAPAERGAAASQDAEPAMDGWLAGLDGAGGGPRRARRVLALQRAAGNQAVGRLLGHVAPPTPPRPRLARRAADTSGRPAGPVLTDAGTTRGPGQLDVEAFFAALEPAVCAAAEEALPAPFTSAGCPWIRHWIDTYRARPAAEVEAAIHRYAPLAADAASPDDLVNAISARVREGIAQWRATGSLERVAALAEPMLAGPATPAATPARPTLARSPPDPGSVQARLDPGTPLDAAARDRFGRAFGRDFSAVRVHNAARDHALASSLQARAVTVGRNIIFGPSQYAPGTLLGDALIAHELAHVVQQEGAVLQRWPDQTVAERDADLAALAALAGQRADPRVRSGLTLSRCGLLDEPEPVRNDAILANAPRVTDAPFQAGDVPGQMPVARIVDGGHRLRLDGDGDQMKELELFVRVTSRHSAHRVRDMTIDVTQLTSGQTRSVQLTLPDSETGNGPAFVLVDSVTDGLHPTEISLVLPQGAQVLRLLPGRRSASGVEYDFELASRPAVLGAGSDTATVSQRQTVRFPADAGPRRVFDVAGPQSTRPGGSPGPRRVGDIWAVDVLAGPYGDRFRLSFRRPNRGGERIDMGISVIDAHNGRPQGGETIELRHSGEYSVSVVTGDGISIGVDLDGDGQAEVRLFDRLRQATGSVSPGAPGVNRIHDIHVLGPAVVSERHLSYHVEEGMITAGRVHPQAEDLPAASNAAAFSGLDDQLHVTSQSAELEQFDLQLESLRTAAHDDGVISDRMFERWRDLMLGFTSAKLAIDRGAVTDEQRTQLARQARDFYAALTAETSEVAPASENPYTGTTSQGRVCIEAGATFAGHIEAGRWNEARVAYRTMVRGLDRWIVERHRARFPSNVAGRPETQRAALMEQLLGQRELVRSIGYHYPHRIRAVFQPNEAWESGGRIAQIPLSLYFWRDGNEWVIKDCTTPAESPEYRTRAAPGALEPTTDDLSVLDSDAHFQAGQVHFILPSGAGGLAVTTGPSRVIHWLTIAGIATAAIGLGLLTAGAGSAVVVTFLSISGVIGATTAGIDLYQRYRTDTLTVRTAILDVGQIAAGLAGPGALVAGRILNSARLAAAAGEAVQATSALRAANSMWVPLQFLTAIGDTAQGLVLVEGAYQHMRQIQTSGANERERMDALKTFLMHLAVTGGLTVLSVRGASAEVLAGRPLSIETVNGVHYAVPTTQSVQGRAIEQSRRAMESAAPDEAAAARQAHLGQIRTTLGAQGRALESVERLALSPTAEGNLVLDAAGALSREGAATGQRLDDLVREVAAANSVGGAHGTTRQFSVVVEAADASGMSRVRVIGGARTGGSAALAEQLVAGKEGALEVAGPVTRGIRGLDPGLRIATTPAGRLVIAGQPDLDLVALTRQLGGPEPVERLATELGAPLARLAGDLPGPEILRLVDDFGAPIARWGGGELSGTATRSLLGDLPTAVRTWIRRRPDALRPRPSEARLLFDQFERVPVGITAPPVDIPYGQRLIRALNNGIDLRDLVPLARQNNAAVAQSILEEGLAGTPQALRRLRGFIANAAAAAGPTGEIARASAVHFGEIIADTQVVSVLRRLASNPGLWAGLQANQREYINRLRQIGGTQPTPAALPSTGTGAVPAAPAVTALPAPTQAEIDGLLARVRVSNVTLAETEVVAGISRGGAMAIEVERNSAAYADMLNELGIGRAKPWAPTQNASPVGTAAGARDRSVVADALFTQRVDPNEIPSFVTGDTGIYVALATRAERTSAGAFVDFRMPARVQGSEASRLSLANPNGFVIEVNGRRLRVFHNASRQSGI